MGLGLGVDSGNTFTDAVLMDLDKGLVLKTAKVPTTHEQLIRGILAAIDEVLEGINPGRIALAVVSTTLATNAVVEGKGRKVALVLLGWEPDGDLKLPPCHLIHVKGRFNARGEEIEPLDWKGLVLAIRRMQSQVEGFAVSGYFSVRNPEHELRAKQLIQEETGLPVVCGHELTAKLGIYRRTVTAVLNARLAPIISSFLRSVEEALRKRGVAAPLMVVRSDGSLANMEWAMRHPVETVLSGPAASAIGGWWLSRVENGVIVDIGGTTTDIISLHEGFPKLNEEGATVGGWRTRVQAVDAWVVGLGGDSEVQVRKAERGFKVEIGPRRVVPLAFADLNGEAIQTAEVYGEVEFFKRVESTCSSDKLDRNSRVLLSIISQQEPANLGLLRKLAREKRVYHLFQTLKQLEDLGLLQRIGFTPTDALHVLGEYLQGKAELAQSGAQILGRQIGLNAVEFSKLVKERFERLITLQLLKKLISEEEPRVEFEQNPLWKYLTEKTHSFMKVRFELDVPIIGIGAPVPAFLPAVARALNSELVQVNHYEVGNAVGAISGSIMTRVEALVVQQPDDQFLIFLPGQREVLQVEDEGKAMEYALCKARELAKARAHSLGAEEVELKLQEKMYRFGRGRIRVVAIGKPAIAEKISSRLIHR